MAMAVHNPLSLSEQFSSLSTSSRSSGSQPDITLLLERPVEGRDGATVFETVSAMSGESVAEVKLRLRAQKQWFTSGHSLVCGDRDLLDYETVGRVAGDSVDFLHVFVRLSDIRSVTAVSSGLPRVSFDYVAKDRHSPGSARSALTDSIERTASAGGGPQGQLQLLPGVNQPACGEPHEDTILHLVVRRGANVGWHSKDDEFKLAVAKSETAEGVKRRIEAKYGWDASSHALLYNGQILSSTQPLASYGLGKDGPLLLQLQPMEPKIGRQLPWGSPPLSSPEHKLYEGWQKARAGLAMGLSPELAPAGTGGSYFIPDAQGHKVAVFKPNDEEPLAVNNPRIGSLSPSTDGYGLRKGICPGEGAVREVAAYLLDHHRFSGVPPTALVSCSGFEGEEVHKGEAGQQIKVGSLQAFVHSDSDCEERGSSAFPVQQVHKIAVLDMRLVNTDRNGANILAKRRQGKTTCSWELTPIDHGYCLPGSLEDVNFEWLYWRQASEPFDDAALAYIHDLDAEQDLALLASHGLKLRPECERVLKVGTLVLKMGAQCGFTPHQIGSVMCRSSCHKSPIEKMHKQAVDLSKAEHTASLPLVQLNHERDAGPMAVDCVSDEVYLHHLAQVLSEYFDEELLSDLH